MEILSPTQIKEKMKSNAKLLESTMIHVNDKMLESMTRGDMETIIPRWYFDDNQAALLISELKSKGWNPVETEDAKGNKILKISP